MREGKGGHAVPERGGNRQQSSCVARPKPSDRERRGKDQTNEETPKQPLGQCPYASRRTALAVLRFTAWLLFPLPICPVSIHWYCFTPGSDAEQDPGRRPQSRWRHRDRRARVPLACSKCSGRRSNTRMISGRARGTTKHGQADLRTPNSGIERGEWQRGNGMLFSRDQGSFVNVQQPS